jgi:K+-transporting ATPase A subunit
MHDSFMPLSGLVMLVFMQIGEVIFGGVGAGLYGMLLYVVLAVFLAGLMVGRTPEYLGRKIEGREVTLAVLAFLSMPLGILVGGAVAATAPAALSAVQDPGPHGLSEILYAYSSATGNNGSAFGGFGAALPWHTTALGLTMLMGRHAIIVPLLAIAGSMLTLRDYADLFRRMIFGTKSEKMAALEPAQIALDLGDLSDIATTGPAAANDDAPGSDAPHQRKRCAASRNMGALPVHLPRHGELIDPKITICP